MLMALINRVVSNTPLALAIAAVAIVAVAFSIYHEWRKNQHEPGDHYWNP